MSRDSGVRDHSDVSGSKVEKGLWGKTADKKRSGTPRRGPLIWGRGVEGKGVNHERKGVGRGSVVRFLERLTVVVAEGPRRPFVPPL